MGRRYNAERALESARRAELAAWDAYVATSDRTLEDVARAPVKGDRVGRVEIANPAVALTEDWYHRDVMGEESGPMPWDVFVLSSTSVSPVESPARVARRKVWERAAARVERARETLEALPPAGHKRRKDGTVYRVQGPRENAARAAGRAAFRAAVGRSLTFALVAVAFLGLFFSACN